MARKWFQLVGGDGNAVTSAAAVSVDIEDVDALRDAVKDKFKDSHLVGIAAPDLTVFENRAKYDAKEALEEDSPIGSFGGSKTDALIVVVPDADDEEEGSHFIRLQAILSVIAAVLCTVIKLFGEDPEDEKKCLSGGAHVWFFGSAAVSKYSCGRGDEALACGFRGAGSTRHRA